MVTCSVYACPRVRSLEFHSHVWPRSCPQTHRNVHFVHVWQGGLYLVATTLAADSSPFAIIDFLNRCRRITVATVAQELTACVRVCVCVGRLAALIKDYCGALSEKTVQMNFALIYELLDEMLVCHKYCIYTHTHTYR